MAINVMNIKLNDFGKENSLRNDVQYILFQKKIKKEEYYSFKELFDFSTNNKVCVDDLEQFEYSEIGNVDKNGFVLPVILDNNERKLEDEDYYKKIDKGDILKANIDDVLISKVRPNLKKYVRIVPENQKIYYTTAFIHLVPKKLKKVIYYMLREDFYKNLVSITRTGKGYPTINEKDLTYMKFNKKIVDKLIINEEKYNQIILEIESKIAELKSRIIPDEEIINEIFRKHFNFNYDKFYELKNKKNYNTTLFDFSNNIDIRNSVKFHKEAIDFVYKEIKKYTKKRIKDFLIEPMCLGKSISPDDYEEKQEYYYISMADIKKYTFDFENAKTVSTEFAKKNVEKNVQKGDILLARSGEGTIGKVAILEDDYKGIFADFIIRIRFNKYYNKKFAYYYFRSLYFQYMIEINKKGLGNNTNIFPIQIKEFPILDIPLEEQENITEEIQKSINEQKKLKTKIDEYQNEIKETILKGVVK